MFRQTVIWIVIFSLIIPRPVVACIWDYDTIAEERRRFPEAHELIAGFFHRHSDVYYQWRISDRLNKPEHERTPADFDDIAVAYEKLGDHQRAIEIINEKIARWPENGRYESEANLGTFLIHSGQFEEGLVHIDRAIRINPQAHFGREIYQKKLVEYIIQQKKNSSANRMTFDSFLLDGMHEKSVKKTDSTGPEVPMDRQSAVKGVLGMMRFGNHDSPVLLEALGDLLNAPGDNANLIAGRAYLKASYEDGAHSSRLRELADVAINKGGRFVQSVEADLQIEIEQGDQLFEQISADEQVWVDQGKNLDVEYAKKYFGPLKLSVNNLNYRSWTPQQILGAIFIAAVGSVAAAALVGIWSRRRSFVKLVNQKIESAESEDHLSY